MGTGTAMQQEELAALVEQGMEMPGVEDALKAYERLSEIANLQVQLAQTRACYSTGTSR